MDTCLVCKAELTSRGMDAGVCPGCWPMVRILIKAHRGQDAGMGFREAFEKVVAVLAK